MSCKNVSKTSSRRLQDVFKTSSRHPAKTSSRHLQDVFKMFSRHLQDIFKTFWRRFEDVFKTNCKDLCKSFSKHMIKLNCSYVLQRRLSKKDLPSSHFWEIYGQCTDFARVIKVSQILVSHFTTPFRHHFQRRI